MNTDREVAAHYSRGSLLSRLNAALTEDGVDPDHPSMDALAPYDQFHGRGLEATLEIAGLMQAGLADHILDIGSGIGGPARYFANRFGCRVTGIDLTPEFCEVARHLTRLLSARGQDHVRSRRRSSDAICQCQLRRRLLDECFHEHRREECLLS